MSVRSVFTVPAANRRSGVIEERYEAEVHVQLLVTVKQGRPRIVRDEIDFVADNPGLTLFHCHQQLHMDFGFMTLFDYV